MLGAVVASSSSSSSSASDSSTDGGQEVGLACIGLHRELEEQAELLRCLLQFYLQLLLASGNLACLRQGALPRPRIALSWVSLLWGIALHGEQLSAHRARLCGFGVRARLLRRPRSPALAAGNVRLLSCAGLSGEHDPLAVLASFWTEHGAEGASQRAAFWPGLDLDATVQAALDQMRPSSEPGPEPDAFGRSSVTFERAESLDGAPCAGRRTHCARACMLQGQGACC